VTVLLGADSNCLIRNLLALAQLSSALRDLLVRSSPLFILYTGAPEYFILDTGALMASLCLDVCARYGVGFQWRGLASGPRGVFLAQYKAYSIKYKVLRPPLSSMPSSCSDPSRSLYFILILYTCSDPSRSLYFILILYTCSDPSRSSLEPPRTLYTLYFIHLHARGASTHGSIN